MSGKKELPAINDANGFCVFCGRDNSEYPNSPCYEDCPGEKEDHEKKLKMHKEQKEGQ